MSLPAIALIGRPNVGKSTLYNRLTKSQEALVADFPGLTRDRQYGLGQIGDKSYWVIDTGGVGEPTSAEAVITENLERQVFAAIESAELIFFLVDAKVGLTAADQKLADILRSCQDKVIIVANKADNEDLEIAKSDFFQLGFPNVHAISALRKRGIKDLMTDICDHLPAPENENNTDEEDTDSKQAIRVAILGRPNVGKSTLTNRMLGEERVIVSDIPGTTRDSISIPFTHRDTEYLLIDTAGVRRRTKINMPIEQESIWQTIRAIDEAHVVVAVVDAQDELTEQDLRLINLVVSRGRGLVFAFNKWDGIDDDDRQRFKDEVDRRLPFAEFARRYFISALHGTGVGKLYHAIKEAYDSSRKDLSTAFLTKVLEQAQTDHQPPLVRGRRVKLRYAHLAGHHPLTIMIHGKQTKNLPGSYQRYLANYFRKSCQLMGVPLIIRMRTDENPYDQRSDTKK